MKMYAETGWLWGAPLSKLKYWIVVPLFMAHDFWSFNNTLGAELGPVCTKMCTKFDCKYDLGTFSGL